MHSVFILILILNHFCLSVDACDGSVTIDDIRWCHNCPGKIWDASGNSCDDISTECDDLTVVTDADHCYACGMRGMGETSWDGMACVGMDCGKSVFFRNKLEPFTRHSSNTLEVFHN